jgi:hypothetical protein
VKGGERRKESSDATPISASFMEGVIKLKQDVTDALASICCHYVVRLASMLGSQHKANKELPKLAAAARDGVRPSRLDLEVEVVSLLIESCKRTMPFMCLLNNNKVSSLLEEDKGESNALMERTRMPRGIVVTSHC